MDVNTTEKIVISDSERSELHALFDRLCELEEDMLDLDNINAIENLTIAIDEFLEICDEE